MEKRSVVNNSITVDKLRSIPFFTKYKNDDNVIRSIISLCEFKKFRKGSTIIKEGDQGDELFIVLKGEIVILKTTLQNEKYVVTSLNSDTGNVFVGELGLIDRDRRSATVEAKTDCECMVLKRNRFIQFGDENPEIGLNITRAIAQELSLKLRKTGTDVITLFSALVEEITGN